MHRTPGPRTHQPIASLPTDDPRRREYYFRTKDGTFWILWRDGYWQPLFDNEPLGWYHTPEEAAENLANGHCWSSASGADPEALGVPEDIDDWEWSQLRSD
jgi:hypothetical protein